jgi:hypothetical protein
MRKTTRNYVLALFMALLALFQVVTWLDLHHWTAIALTVIVLVHVILQWGGIVRMTGSYFSQK